MNRELTQSFRGRTYSEGTDDITDNEEKQKMVALLKECGETYVDHIQKTSNEEVQNHDDETELPGLHFETLEDDAVSGISESIEDLTTSEENDNQLSTKIDCIRCAKVTRVEDGTILKAGSHVKFGRYAFCEKFHKFLNKHLNGSLRVHYTHHAIVTEIHMQSKQKVSFDAVEFTRFKDDNGNSTTEVVQKFHGNVDVDDELMYVVDYKHLPFTADEIVERARKHIGPRTYSLFTDNCEHFAIWCVTNVNASFQSDNACDTIRNWTTWFSSMMAKCFHIKGFVNEIISATKSLFIRVGPASLAASMSSPIVCAIVESILLLKRLRQLKDHLNRRLICLRCYISKKSKIIIKLVIGFTVSIALIIPTTPYALPIIGFSLLALAVLPWACEKIIRRIKAKINPTSVIPQMVVHSITDIKPGDILSELTGFTTHDVVVERVELLPRTVPLKTVSMDVVHYTFRGIFGTRTVVMDHLDLNLETEGLFVYDFPEQLTFPPEEVISRAKQILGERKFNMFTRRSSHMAFDCKVLEGFKPAYTKRLVKSVDEVHAGDVIQYRYRWLPHAAVVSETNTYIPADIIELKYVHVDKNGKVAEGSKIIDLENSYVFVQIYDENETEENAEVVRKAKERVGEENHNWKFCKSARFALSCKLKAIEENNNRD